MLCPTFSSSAARAPVVTASPVDRCAAFSCSAWASPCFSPVMTFSIFCCSLLLLLSWGDRAHCFCLPHAGTQVHPLAERKWGIFQSGDEIQGSHRHPHRKAALLIMKSSAPAPIQNQGKIHAPPLDDRLRSLISTSFHCRSRDCQAISFGNPPKRWCRRPTWACYV